MEKTIKKAMTLAEAIETDVQAVAGPAVVSALESSKKNKEIADKAVEDAEKATDDLVKNGQPDSHRDVPSEIKAEMKKLHLAESLEEADGGEVLSENSIEDIKVDPEVVDWKLDTRSDKLLDGCFAYLRDLKGDSEFVDFAQEYLKMTPEELLFYCDIDVDDMDESLNEADDRDDEYPNTFLGSKTRFRRKNLTNMSDLEITYPSFTVKYVVEPGVQTKPGDPVELGFERDELARLEVVRSEADRLEKIFKETAEKTLAERGYKNVYIGGSILVGVPNALHLMGNKVGESLNEAVKESTFTQLYRDLVAIPYVDRFIRTKFSPDESEVDVRILLDDYVDIDAVYDVLDNYKDRVTVSEDDEAIRIHTRADDALGDTSIPEDLFDEIMTQLTLGGRMIPGKGKGYVTDYGAGYDELRQVSNVQGDKGIAIRVFPGHEEDRKGFEASFEPAKAIADKYKDLGVYYTERNEIESTSPHRTTKVLTIWIPEDAAAAGRDERLKRRKVKKEELDESDEKSKYVIKHENGKYVSKDYNVGSFDRAAKFATKEEAEKFISDNGKDKTWSKHYTIVDALNEGKRTKEDPWGLM